MAGNQNLYPIPYLPNQSTLFSFLLSRTPAPQRVCSARSLCPGCVLVIHLHTSYLGTSLTQLPDFRFNIGAANPSSRFRTFYSLITFMFISLVLIPWHISKYLPVSTCKTETSVPQLRTSRTHRSSFLSLAPLTCVTGAN